MSRSTETTRPGSSRSNARRARCLGAPRSTGPCSATTASGPSSENSRRSADKAHILAVLEGPAQLVVPKRIPRPCPSASTHVPMPDPRAARRRPRDHRTTGGICLADDTRRMLAAASVLGRRFDVGHPRGDHPARSRCRDRRARARRSRPRWSSTRATATTSSPTRSSRTPSTDRLTADAPGATPSGGRRGLRATRARTIPRSPRSPTTTAARSPPATAPGPSSTRGAPAPTRPNGARPSRRCSTSSGRARRPRAATTLEAPLRLTSCCAISATRTTTPASTSSHRTTYADAIEIAERVDDTVGLARARARSHGRRRRVRRLQPHGHRLGARRDARRRARGRLPEQAGQLRALVTARIAGARYDAGDVETAQALSSEALELARSTGDARADRGRARGASHRAVVSRSAR